MSQPITENTLFYGDNLPILRGYIPDESVDLTYLELQRHPELLEGRPRAGGGGDEWPDGREPFHR